MEMKNVLFTLLGKPVTLYAALLVCAFVLGLLMLYREQKKASLRSDTTEIFALLALPLGLICARLFYCLARLTLYMEIGLESVLRLWEGGYALWGAFGGVVIAALLTARITRQSAVRLLDALAIPAALTIALARFSEFANGEGIGLELYNPLFQRFPFAVYNADWDTWFYAIFILEGAAALVIALVLYFMKLKQPGSRAKAFLILYCSVQILLESLRRDNFLRWLFVRVSQLTAVLVLGGMLFWALYRWAKAPKTMRMPGRMMIINWVLFLLGVGVCIAMEFAVDKSAYMPVWLCYSIMAVCCVVMGYTAWQVIMKNVKAAE